MAVSHRGKRSIVVNGKQYLWRVKKLWDHEEKLPWTLEIIDPDLRIKKRYNTLSRLDACMLHMGAIEPVREWDDDERRLISMGAITKLKDTIIVVTPRIVAKLIMQDFLGTNASREPLNKS